MAGNICLAPSTGMQWKRNEHDSAGLQTSFPVLMKIQKPAGVAVK